MLISFRETQQDIAVRVYHATALNNERRAMLRAARRAERFKYVPVYADADGNPDFSLRKGTPYQVTHRFRGTGKLVHTPLKREVDLEMLLSMKRTQELRAARNARIEVRLPGLPYGMLH